MHGASFTSAHKKRGHEENEKEQEKDFGYGCGGASDDAKAEHGGNQRYDKKKDGVIKHGVLVGLNQSRGNRKTPVRPTTASTAPPISSHIDLSVGVPVNSREKLEPMESDALNPYMIRMTPATSRMMDIVLFMGHFR